MCVCPPAIKQHPVSTPAILRHQCGCHHPGDTPSDVLGTVPLPLSGRRRANTRTKPGGECSLCHLLLVTVTRRWQGEGGGSQATLGGRKGTPLSPPWPPPTPLPGHFNTGGSARPGRWLHIQLVPLRLILSKAGFGRGAGGGVYFGEPLVPPPRCNTGSGLILGLKRGGVFLLQAAVTASAIHPRTHTHTKLE